MQRNIYFLLLAFNLISGLAFAKEIKLKVCSHDLPPHTYQTEDGKPLGLASEILQLVAKDLNWKLEIEYFSWMRLRANSIEGKCDISYTALKKVEYLDFFEYPKESLIDRHAVFIVRKGSGITYNNNLKEFLKKYSVGRYRDKFVSPEFEKLVKEDWVKIEEPTKSEQVFPMLLNDRFVAAIEDRQVAIFELKRIGKLAEVEILDPAIYVTPAYFVFPKKGGALGLMKEFDLSLAKIKKSAAYLEIINRYSN